MDVIVYVETNFLMSVAMGRERRGDDLLGMASASVRIAIPSSCYMESFSAFEAIQKGRNKFHGELEKQIGQLRRDITSENARTLRELVEKSRIANSLLLNDVQERLYGFVERASSILEPIVEPGSVIRDAVTERIIPDPTDNLILHAILHHARGFPRARKVLLTENTQDFGHSSLNTTERRDGV